jgi:hypothetical protein
MQLSVPLWIAVLRDPSSPTLSPCEQLPKILDDIGVPYWHKVPKKTADKADSNHGISAMKFQLVRVSGGAH